ncbi:hypothetical protein HNQ39_005107 [Armatimonas rosea]|uniref:Uncharacterized protein n=1 Tax=Armatimonas rosea TaxID=685828 RepID=A0A7W9SVQ9_ARMRO|nr:hypothetical protein [Armatimonas rosea]
MKRAHTLGTDLLYSFLIVAIVSGFTLLAFRMEGWI